MGPSKVFKIILIVNNFQKTVETTVSTTPESLRIKMVRRDPLGSDLTNFKANVGRLSDSELGESRVHFTQFFELYADQKPVFKNFVLCKMALFRVQKPSPETKNLRNSPKLHDFFSELF